MYAPEIESSIVMALGNNHNINMKEIYLFVMRETKMSEIIYIDIIP